MNLDGVRTFLDDDFAFHVVLDSDLCRKRDLTESILEQSEKSMRALLREKKIHYFQIFKTNFVKAWSQLAQEKASVSRQILLAQGTPDLRGLKFQFIGRSLRIAWDEDARAKVRPAWMLLEYKRYCQENAPKLKILDAQVIVAYYRFLDRSDEAGLVTLTPLPIPAKNPAWQLFMREGEPEIYLKISSKNVPAETDLADIKGQIASHAEHFPDRYGHFFEEQWESLQRSAEKGEIALGLEHADIVLLGKARPSWALKKKPKISRAGPLDARNFDRRAGSSALFMGKFLTLAEAHLRQTDASQRFLANISIAFDASRREKLFTACEKRLSLLGDKSAQEGNYVIAFQAIPIFSIESLAKGGKTDKKKFDGAPWIKSILREACGLNLSSFDPREMAACFTVPVSPEEVEKALAELMVTGQIAEEGGRFVLQSAQVQTPDEITGEAIVQYYASLYEVMRHFAAQALPRYFSWSSLPIFLQPEAYAAKEQALIQATKEILGLEEKAKEKNAVFQLAFQLMPFHV